MSYAKLKSQTGSGVLTSMVVMACVGFSVTSLLSTILHTKSISYSSRLKSDTLSLQDYVKARFSCDNTKAAITSECNSSGHHFINVVSSDTSAITFISKPTLDGIHTKIGPFSVRAQCECTDKLCAGTRAIRVQYAILTDSGKGRRDPLGFKKWEWAPLYPDDSALNCLVGGKTPS